MKKEIILQADHLRTWFPVKGFAGQTVGNVKAVDDVSLKLYRGETYGLVGETGCGKSTLGRTLIRLLDPTEGTITVDGQDITKLSHRQLQPIRSKMQMVFQDPYTSLDGRMHVGDILMETLAIQNAVPKKDRMDHVLSILAEVGLLPEHFYRYPHELSGGQRQRVGLARALLLQPDLIVCDEPVSALDVSIQAQIINTFEDLQQKLNIAYLFIAHDLLVVRHMSNRIAVMYLGRIVVRYMADRVGVMYLGHLVEEAETDALFENPQHPYTQVLLSAVPTPDPHTKRERTVLEGDLPSPIDPPSGCVFHTRCPYATEQCAAECPETRELAPGHKVACHRAK